MPNTKYGYANMEGKFSANYSLNTTRPQMLLADGVSLSFLPHNSGGKIYGLDIHFDVNGHKKPNVIGYDLFSLDFYPYTGEILPCGINEETFNEETGEYVKPTPEEITDKCLNDEGGGQWECTAKVVQDGFKINY